jgi:hypothetical protein
MSWIKRNLYFLIGAVVALGLLAVAMIYYSQKEGANNEVKEKLNAAYAELKRINDSKDHPGYANAGGSTNKVDNIAIGQSQIKGLGAFLGQARAAFVPVPSIPDNARLSGQEFTADLLRTIDQMRRDSRSAGITLPASNYNFSFDSIVPKVTFSPSSLQLLARQLGEVKVICDVLVSAKINALDGWRRVKVCSEDETTRFPNDYLNQTPQTNDWAVLEPFELKLRCFSSELASVMVGLASSPYGVIVKTINIEAAPPTASAAVAETAPAPAFFPQPMPAAGGGRGYGQYGRMPMQGYAPPRVVRPAASVTAPSKPVLYEQAVRVTLTVVFVQVGAPKGDAAGGNVRRGGPGRRPK